MEENSNYSKMLFIATIFFVLINIAFYPKLIIIHIFAIIYLIYIYTISNNVRSYMYFTTILFAFIDFSLLLPIGSRFGLYYSYISILVYYSILIFMAIKTKKIPKLKITNKYMMFSVVFVSYLVISLFIANSKVLAVKSIMNYIFMILLTVVFIIENKDKVTLGKTFKLIKYIFIGILILGIFEVLGFRYGVRNHYSDMGIYADAFPFIKRVPVVFFYNPNNFAVVLVLGILILLIESFESNSRKQKIINALLILIAQINLIFTTSRTGWATLLISISFCFVIYLFSKNYSAMKKVGRSLFLILLVFFIFSLLPGMNPYYGKLNSTPF